MHQQVVLNIYRTLYALNIYSTLTIFIKNYEKIIFLRFSSNQEVNNLNIL